MVAPVPIWVDCTRSLAHSALLFRQLISLLYSIITTPTFPMQKDISEYLLETLNKPNIDSIEDWRSFMKSLSQQRVILLSEQHITPEDSLTFPIPAKEVQRILLQSKTNPTLVKMLFQIKHLQSLLRDCTHTVTAWRRMGLSKEEETEVEAFVNDMRERLEGSKGQLKSHVDKMEAIDQSFVQAIEKLEQLGPSPQQQTAERYQEDMYERIEEYSDKIKVREIYERRKQLKVDFKEITVYTAFNKLDHRPIEVTRIPKSYTNFKKFEEILITFDALRQLIFCPSFPSYLGYSNTGEESSHHYYFSELVEGIPLQDLLIKSKYHLQEETPIFQYWFRHLFFAFRDIYSKCRYMPLLPIPLHCVVVADSGLTLRLKGLRFSRLRGERDNRNILESKLLRNFALLCMQMLGLTEEEVQKVNNINTRLLLKGLLRSEYQQARFDSQESSTRFSFPLLSSMPLLSNQFILDCDSSLLTATFNQIFL